MTRRTVCFANVIIMLLTCFGTVLVGISGAQKSGISKPIDTRVVETDKVKELMVLMDSNPNGKISKQQWLKFMEAQFDKLDLTKKGEIDIKEILQSSHKLRAQPEALGK